MMEHTLNAKWSAASPWQRIPKSKPLVPVLMAIFLLFVFIKSLSPPQVVILPSPDNSFALISSRTQRKASLPALSKAKQRDLTMSDYECQRNFPLLYPQLEVLEKYWQERGGITKQMLDENERGGTERWGFVRVSTRCNLV